MCNWSTVSWTGSMGSLNPGRCLLIKGWDSIRAKGYARSNRSRRSKNERCRDGVRRSAAVRLGSTAGSHGPRWSSFARGSGAWEATGLRAKWRAARGDSYLGQRWRRKATIVARDGGTTPPGSVDDDGRLRFSSGSNKRSGSLATGSSCFPKPSIAVSGSGRWRAMAAARVLGLGVCGSKPRWFKPLFIGIFAPNHRRQWS
jgi:hypothetical protein